MLKILGKILEHLFRILYWIERFLWAFIYFFRKKIWVFSLLVSLINLCWKLTLLNSNASEYDLFLQVKGPTDHSYFDSYPPEEEIPPDEMSGWDTDF